MKEEIKKCLDTNNNENTIIQSLWKATPKEYSNYHTIAFISHASKTMLKILQARLQQYMNQELPDVQAGFQKGKGIRDQVVNICWIMEKAKEFHKNFYFCFMDLGSFSGCL